MATATERTSRPKAGETITIRVPAQTRDLIDSAAAALGKSRTEFLLDAARQSAVDALLDRRVFHLNEADSEAFARVLANPPSPNAALRELAKRKPVWR